MGNCVGGKGPKKDPKILTEEEIKLLLDNTRLTRPQILALHANFLKECPTGKLTKKDFVKLFKEVHPSENKKEKADKFCEYVFKVIDQQNLGYISFQEFVLCFSLTSDGDFKDKCEFAFRLYDLDKDGKISKKEMTQVLTALYDLSGITDRKGDKAPAKKVEDIIKKINATYHPPPPPDNPSSAAETSQASPETSTASPSKEDKKKAEKAEKDAKKDKKKDTKEKDSKDAKSKDKDAKKEKDAKKDTKKDAKEKPAKEAKPAKEPKAAKAKPIDFITKEQFIEACSSDEAIKKLFVDSIFSSASDDSNNNDNKAIEINTSNTINIKAPSVNISGPSITGPSISGPSISGPSISVNSSPSKNPQSSAPTDADIKNIDKAIELNKSIITHTTTIDLHDADPNVSTSVTTNTNIHNNVSSSNDDSNKHININLNNSSSNNNDNNETRTSLASDSELWQSGIPEQNVASKENNQQGNSANDSQHNNSDSTSNKNENEFKLKIEPGSVEINTSSEQNKQQ